MADNTKAIPNTVEYNKIHSLAKARKKVIEKFGKDLLHFWPLADQGNLFRDLTRRKALTGRFDVTPSVGGFIDYGISVGESGHVGDHVGKVGASTDSGNAGQTGAGVAIDMPAGLYEKVQIRWVNDEFRDLYVAPAGLSPTEVEEQYIYKDDQHDGDDFVTSTFDHPIAAGEGELQVYVKDSQNGWNESMLPYAGQGDYVPKWYAWDDANSKWDEHSTPADSRFFPPDDSETWPGMTGFTMYAAIDPARVRDGGIIVCLANSTEAKAYLKVKSDLTIEAYFKDSSGDTYTRTSSRRLHPGFNLIAASWEYYDDDGTDKVDTKLFMNGRVDDSATATPGAARDLFDEALCVGIGAQVLTDSTDSDHLKFGVIDDVFMAEKAIPNVDHWELYMTYITTAPLMQVESADTIVLE